MKLINTFLLIFLGFSLSAQSDLLSYTKKNYQINFPKTWSLDSSGIMGSEFFVFSPLESQNDKFRENVNLIIQDLKGQNISLEQYESISKTQIKQFLTDANIIESRIEESPKGRYMKLLYTMKQGAFNLKTLSICFIKAEKAYLLTLSMEASQYDKFEKIGRQIMDSFNLF